jgi:transitional endoplasmic reticulum ATPase
VNDAQKAFHALVEELNRNKEEEKQMKTNQTQTNRFDNIDVGIEYHGTKITLPAEPHQMRTDEAITALQRFRKAQEEVVSIHETVKAFPLEGAWAFMKAMQRRYGWVSAKPTPGFFGPNPPVMANVEIGFGEHGQVIWGGFEVPNVEGQLQTGASAEGGRRVFCIRGEVKKKYQEEIKALADLTRKIAREESIYRGKAVRVVTTEKGTLNYDEAPTFIDTSTIRPEELIFPKQLQEEVNASLYTPIEKTELCRAMRIPLKRGILLEGPFGTGKTMASKVAAKKCEENGWTFILLDRVSGLKDALQLAREYQPCVVFAEDVDRAVSGDNRTASMDDILNTINGAESKGTEIITVLTSNEVEKINRAMIRPGRLDAVLTVSAPDAEAAQRLIRLYGRDLIGKDEDLTAVGKELDGQIPAVIREVVERAKLHALARLQKNEFTFTLTGQDLVHAARSMKRHLELLNPPKTTEPTPEQKLGNALAEVVKGTVYGNGLFEAATRTKAVTERIAEYHGLNA